MNRVWLKEEAKQSIKGNLWELWKPLLIAFAISFVASAVLGFLIGDVLGFKQVVYYDAELGLEYVNNYGELLASILVTPINYGVVMYFDEFDRNRFADVNIIFHPYKYFVKIVVIALFVEVLISIGTMLFVIPGVILSIAFTVITFTYMRHPELEVIEMVAHAWKMMKGHKMEFFMLDLSFIGWYLACAATCGIACIYVVPYTQMTFVKYFRMIDEEYSGVNIPHTTVY